MVTNDQQAFNLAVTRLSRPRTEPVRLLFPWLSPVSGLVLYLEDTTPLANLL